MSIVTALTLQAFDPEARLRDFMRVAGEDCGALSSFVGLCRGRSASGEPIGALDLQHYPGFTETVLAAAMAAVRAEHGAAALLAVHRVGRIAPGEAIVLVAALATHRASAMRAVEAAMDFLKTDLPVWKREHQLDGAVRWIEPTAEDQERRKRWR